MSYLAGKGLNAISVCHIDFHYRGSSSWGEEFLSEKFSKLFYLVVMLCFKLQRKYLHTYTHQLILLVGNLCMGLYNFSFPWQQHLNYGFFSKKRKKKTNHSSSKLQVQHPVPFASLPLIWRLGGIKWCKAFESAPSETLTAQNIVRSPLLFQNISLHTPKLFKKYWFNHVLPHIFATAIFYCEC